MKKFLITLCLLLSCSQANGNMLNLYNYTGTVTKVFDGDTVEVLVDLGFNIYTAQRFRIYQINAPETRTKDKKEKANGLLAKEYLKKLIDGKQVRIKTIKNKSGKEKMTFTRYVAIIYVTKNKVWFNVGQLMIKAGHAKPYYHK